MLFRRNGESIKFCLARLEVAERAEIENLITENGGKVCSPSKNGSNRVYGDSFFHINYIYECLKQGELLDLHSFSILGLRSFTHEKRGSFLADNDKSRIYIEHNYTIRVSLNEEPSNDDSFHPVPLIVLVPSLVNLPRSSICSLRQMYSSMTKNNVVKESDSPTKKMNTITKEKRQKENKNPNPDYPLLILHRWVKDSKSEAVTEKINVQRCNTKSFSAGSERRLNKRSRTAAKKRSVKSISELPLSESLQGLSSCEESEDVPLIERLRGLRASEPQDRCDDSDDFVNPSFTVRKKRILSSSSDDDSAGSDATVVTRGSNRIKRSKKDQESLEESNDSDKTILWGDFSRKKKKGNDERRSSPRCIDDDSTDAETVPTRDSVQRETKFSRSTEPVETITRIERSPPRKVVFAALSSDDDPTDTETVPTRDSVQRETKFSRSEEPVETITRIERSPPCQVVFAALSSDEKEYEADTELEDDDSSRAETKEGETNNNNEDESDSAIEIKETEKLDDSTGRVAETSKREKEGETHNEDGNDSAIEIKEPKKMENREPSPGCSSSATKDDDNDVIVVSDDNESDAGTMEISSDSDDVAPSCRIPTKKRSTRSIGRQDRKKSRIVPPSQSSDSDSSSADEPARSPARIAVPIEPPTKKKKTVHRSERPAINGPNGATHHKLSRNFQLWEQKLMVKYLIDHDAIAGARGNAIWQQMIKNDFLTHRTFQSLNNHFRRYILPIIHRFNIDEDNLARFQRLSK